MAQIQGKYICTAKVTGAAYTFTGADRQADFGLTGAIEDNELIVNCINHPNGAMSDVVFNVENKITIKRIRLIGNGAPGVQRGVNHDAAEFNLLAAAAQLDGVAVYDTLPVIIPNWGEWYDINATIEPYKRTGGVSSDDYVGFYLDPSNCVFYVDDYNLQGDFVGQGVTPIIEMEIETAGLTARSNGVLF